jgi:hypothetical protein
LKKLFGVLTIAVMLSCAAVGWAFGEGLLPSDEPAMENEYEASEFLAESMVFSPDPGDWAAVIVKQDYSRSVFVRLYGKAKDGAAPSEVFAGVSGIDSPRAWIGDANGSADYEDGYLIIEGAAPSENDALNAHVNWVGYRDRGRTLVQVFTPNPIMVREMSGGVADSPRDGGCDAGFGGMPLSLLFAAFAAVCYTRKSSRF